MPKEISCSSVAIARLDFVDPGPDIFTLAREPKNQVQSLIDQMKQLHH